MALTSNGGFLLGSVAYHTPPFTVGMWANITTGHDYAGFLLSSPVLWSLADTVNYGIHITLTGGGDLGQPILLDVSVGSGDTVSGTIAPIGWTFVLARVISDTSRRIDVLYPGGLLESVVGNGTSLDVAGASVLNGAGIAGFPEAAFGANVNTNNATSIGEWWMLNADVQPDGLAVQPAIMQNLAYGGPFSLAHLAANVIEYRSFRNGPSAYHSVVNRIGNVWTSSSNPGDGTPGTMQIAPHPPLPYWYRQPGKIITAPISII